MIACGATNRRFADRPIAGIGEVRGAAPTWQFVASQDRFDAIARFAIKQPSYEVAVASNHRRGHDDMAKTKGEPLAKVKVAGRVMRRGFPEPRLSEALGSRPRRGLAIFNPPSRKIRRRTRRPPPPDSRRLLLRQAIIQKKICGKRLRVLRGTSRRKVIRECGTFRL